LTMLNGTPSSETMKKVWRIWCKTMGNKISDSDSEADAAAVIRTIFWVVNLVTCLFIIAGIIKHWND